MDTVAVQIIVDRFRRQNSDDGKAEAKAAGEGLPKSVWSSVSAFANTDGGVILLGIDERNGFKPTAGFDAGRVIAQWSDGVSQAPQSSPKIIPVPTTRVSRVDFEGAQVVVIEIDALRGDIMRPMPCYVTANGVRNGSYKRVDDRDERLSPYEIYLLQNNETPSNVDRAEVPDATVDDFNEAVLDDTIRRLRRLHSHALDGTDGDRSLALKRINMITVDHAPTFAGVLCAGIYPQQFFPQLFVDVAVHVGAEKSSDEKVRFLDRRMCDGPVPAMVESAVSGVLANLKTRRIINGAGGRDVPEIPEDVIREAVVNAVTHRDYSPYSRGTQIAVDVYSDRVEVTNPGGFWADRNATNLADGISASRNPVLAKMLTILPDSSGDQTVAENQGSGVARMYGSMKAAGLRPPEYWATVSSVKVILWRPSEYSADVDDDYEDYGPGGRKLTPTMKEIVGVLREYDETMSIGDIVDKIGRSRLGVQRSLRELISRGLVVATAPPTSHERRYALNKGRRGE